MGTLVTPLGEPHWSFPLMDQKFTEFSEFRGQFKDPLCCLCLAGAAVAS